VTAKVILSCSPELDHPEHGGGGFQMPDFQQRAVHEVFLPTSLKFGARSGL
jgi:hypothetical protein